MGNLVSSRSAQQPCKEQYTGQLYKQFCTEKHVEAVKHFLEVISTFGTHSEDDFIKEPVLLKEGYVNYFKNLHTLTKHFFFITN